jgi:RHS repeat-associated protein
MPFGELWYNQQASAYNERFKFTGKERDEESGYDYFGARNYTSDASIWLSVDPLADKYPGISPYAYCSWILLFGYISPSKTN